MNLLECQMSTLGPLAFMGLVSIVSLWLAVSAYSDKIDALLKRLVRAVKKVVE